MYELQEVFNMLVLGPHRTYVFVEGHPIDTRGKKYKLFWRWYKKEKLYCFGCHRKAHHFTMKACKSNGCFHSSGKRKHTFFLYSEDGVQFTLDHWYPKSWLISVGLRNSVENLVPMCGRCNNKKKNELPILGWWGKSWYIPSFAYC